MNKNRAIEVDGITIGISTEPHGEYISLTGMIAGLENKGVVIGNRLRTKSTLNFLGVWETMNNPDFNSIKFDGIRMEQGVPSFTMSVKKRITSTNAIGIKAKSGRYGGTYAHKDIAFEFAMAISPEFKLYMIKEYERLKQIENNQYNLEWNLNRVLAKVNYRVHTDAVRDFVIPKLILSGDNTWLAYAEEADMLNVAVFGYTQKQRCEANPDLCSKGLNQREFASINENLVLSRMEIINAVKMEEGLSIQQRFEYIQQKAVNMLGILNNEDVMKSIKRTDSGVYLTEDEEENTQK